jgi:cytochrome c biogenesis protein CcdA
MQTDTINIGLGFLEGFALIISPCILPVLPIFLAGSLTGSKKRPIGIIIGFIAVFSLLTFFSRKLVQVSGIDLTLVRYFSYGLLVLLGIIMLSDTLTEKFSSLTQGLTGTGSSLESINNPQGGVISGILFGGLVAIIWTPCAGPILAAVIVQTVINRFIWEKNNDKI